MVTAGYVTNISATPPGNNQGKALHMKYSSTLNSLIQIRN
eukprot:CCRYP_005883-RA/>CCRYP_005883-RA protein AED:0.43 eAED:0.43 QI:102/1/0.5/1/0/0/2/0/39